MSLRPALRPLLRARSSSGFLAPLSLRPSQRITASRSFASEARPDTTPTSQPDGQFPSTLTPPSNEAQDSSVTSNDNGSNIDWRTSYHGIGSQRFPPEVAELLTTPVVAEDIEIKPDGVLYLPEIKYRRILNAAFGPGGWGLVPRGDIVVGDKVVTREYALIAEGRFVSQAQGENNYFSLENLPSAVEGCKSNALMRCCKDLGIASELWDPVFLRAFKKKHAHEVWVEHLVTKKKKPIWLRKDQDVPYPYKRTAPVKAT